MTAVAVFVKTPGHSSIKTRLAASLGKEKAEAFYLLSCQWTAQVLKETQSQVICKPFWAVAEKEALNSSYWKSFESVYQGEGDLGDRLYLVYESLLRRFGSVIVLGADSPELSAEDIIKAVRELNGSDKASFVLGKTIDGGFYLFGGKVGVPREIWKSIEYSQNTTGNSLEKSIQYLGSIKFLPICADVDLREDLREVMSRLKVNDPQKHSALLALNLI